MNTDISMIDQELSRKIKTEKKLRTRSVGFVVVILIFSIAWMIYSSWRLQGYQQKIGRLKDSVAQLQRILDSVNDLTNHIVHVDFMIIKHLFATDPGAASMVDQLLELKGQKNIRFSYYADQASAQKGLYCSSSLMISLLKKNTFLGSEVGSGEDLKKELHAHAYDGQKGLRSGDIVFYRSGYVMLYVREDDVGSYGGMSFCIGMTPFGILALDPYFADIELVAHPNYRRGNR